MAEADGTDVKRTSRRTLLRRALGVTAAVSSPALEEALAQKLRGHENESIGLAAAPAAEIASGKPQISLIIDDGSPVDPLFYEIPGYESPLVVPLEHVKRVAETLERFELRGKMTLIPMPSCLGRIDQSLKKVPQAHLESFREIIRARIAPRFDITPEFITHLNAYNLKTGKYQHIYEDVWISQAPLQEIVDYFVLAFTILKNVGLNATGITSPWVAGIDVERKYAQALAEAQWKTFGRKQTWYFLNVSEWGAPQQCYVEYEDPERRLSVVSVPANFPDIFWSMDLPTRSERVQFIRNNIDRVLSADGRTGRLRELIESGSPAVLLTHWQSLYTQGTGLGLIGLTTLMERIQKVFGSTLEWVSCSERARRFTASTKPPCSSVAKV
jgi:hypothetical protein